MSRWIVRTERAIGEDIPGPPGEVRDVYVDLDNIRDFHPLVVSVDVLSHEKNAGGYQKTYRVRDRIPLGPLTIGISYWARVQVSTQGEVITEARQFPQVRLNGVVSFEPTETGTRLTERLTIAAPRLLAATTVRTAVAAHAELLAGIRRHFERR